MPVTITVGDSQADAFAAKEATTQKITVHYGQTVNPNAGLVDPTGTKAFVLAIKLLASGTFPHGVVASDFGVATMTSTKISTGAVEPSVNVTVAGCSLLLATVARSKNTSRWYTRRNSRYRQLG